VLCVSSVAALMADAAAPRIGARSAAVTPAQRSIFSCETTPEFVGVDCAGASELEQQATTTSNAMDAASFHAARMNASLRIVRSVSLRGQ
jgi:hypothetical protein